MNSATWIVLVLCMLLALLVLYQILSGGLNPSEYFQFLEDAMFEYVLQ